MASKITDLDEMMKTLARVSTDPQSVSVGEFAKAVQSLQAELEMLESEVDRLGSTVGAAFEPTDTDAASSNDDMALPVETASAVVAPTPE